MGSLIDTNILIETERKRLDLASHIAERENEEFFISVISVSELLHGVQRARDLVVKGKRAASSERIISQFTVLEIDQFVARTHAALWATMEASGQMIGIHDLWLAATCVAHDLKMVTANVREFNRVPNLIVENWTAA